MRDSSGYTRNDHFGHAGLIVNPFPHQLRTLLDDGGGPKIRTDNADVIFFVFMQGNVLG